MNKLIYVLCFLFFAAVVGCGKSDRAPSTQQPENKIIITETVETVTQQSQPAATNTVVIPAPTFTPVPTLTPKNQPTITTVAAITLKTKDDFGDGRNLLTGELMKDPDSLKRRPIAVKISNSPAKYTRPQAGLNSADIVYEHITEGSITRFTAIIYGEIPEKMGPIRSARLIDLQIPVMYDAALAYSGSSIGVSRKLFSSDFSTRILRTLEQGYYRTGENKPYEHTLYAHPEDFWSVLEQKGENRAPEFNAFMTFSSEAPINGLLTKAVNIQYLKFTSIDWRFDPDDETYLRWVDGEKHLDANSGQQINAANIVLIFAPHQLDTTICEFQSGDQCLAYSMQIDLMGEGTAVVLRDGQRYDVTWRRNHREDMLILVDELGLPFPLQIGNTWFQIMPQDYPAPIFEDG